MGVFAVEIGGMILLAGAMNRGSERMRAKLAKVKAELRKRMHLPLPEQGRWLASVVTGHARYYGVPGNSRAIQAFRREAIRHWHKALSRRSQKGQVPWDRMGRIARRRIPPARITHPYPDARFAATHPR